VKPGRGDDERRLSYGENMVAGGLSRAVAQAMCHPLNVAKTLLQTGDGVVTTLPLLLAAVRQNPGLVFRGLPSQALLSGPTGAVHFATLELARGALAGKPGRFVPVSLRRCRPAMDLLAASCGTLLASCLSVPQTVLVDRIMAGHYPNVATGARRLWQAEGLRGFYRGWSPAMGSKVREHRREEARLGAEMTENAMTSTWQRSGSTTFTIPFGALRRAAHV
jgi:hypothetical protein